MEQVCLSAILQHSAYCRLPWGWTMVSNSDSSYSLSMQLKAWGTPRGGGELCYAGERFLKTWHRCWSDNQAPPDWHYSLTLRPWQTSFRHPSYLGQFCKDATPLALPHDSECCFLSHHSPLHLGLSLVSPRWTWKDEPFPILGEVDLLPTRNPEPAYTPGSIHLLVSPQALLWSLQQKTGQPKCCFKVAFTQQA